MSETEKPALDLKAYAGQFGKVQAIFSMLLGLTGHTVDGKFMGTMEVQRTSTWMREPKMGDELIATMFALLIHEYHEMDFTEEQIFTFWQEMVHQAEIAQLASTTAPSPEFMRTH